MDSVTLSENVKHCTILSTRLHKMKNCVHFQKKTVLGMMLCLVSLQKFKKEKRLSLFSEEDGTGHDVVASLQNIRKNRNYLCFQKKMGLDTMLCPDSRS